MVATFSPCRFQIFDWAYLVSTNHITLQESQIVFPSCVKEAAGMNTTLARDE